MVDLIINPEKSKLKPTQVFSFMGYEYQDSALVKPTEERWLRLSGFDPTTQVKTCFDSKMFDVANWVACLNGEKWSRRDAFTWGPFSFTSRSTGDFLSHWTAVLPWTETISTHLEWWQNPTNMMKGADLNPQDHSIQLCTDTSNKGWGAHLEQASTKGLWSDREKRYT